MRNPITLFCCCFFATLLICCKKKAEDVNYVQKMQGDHAWHGNVVLVWMDPDSSYEVSYSLPIYVVNDSTIVFTRAYDERMKRLLHDRDRKKIVFTSNSTPTSFYQSDTITFDYGANVIYYESFASGAGHITREHLQTP